MLLLLSVDELHRTPEEQGRATRSITRMTEHFSSAEDLTDAEDTQRRSSDQ